MIDLNSMQKRAYEWCQGRFPDATNQDQLLNMGEELGELMRAYLKRKQKIRGTSEYWDLEEQKELADVLISTMCYAERAGLSLEDLLVEWLPVVIETKTYGTPMEA